MLSRCFSQFRHNAGQNVEVVMLPHGVDTLVIILGVLRQALPLLPLSISHGNRTENPGPPSVVAFRQMRSKSGVRVASMVHVGGTKLYQPFSNNE